MSSKGVRKFKLQAGQLYLSDCPPPSTVTQNPILVALVSVCVINVVRKEALAPFNERIKISNQAQVVSKETAVEFSARTYCFLKQNLSFS